MGRHTSRVLINWAMVFFSLFFTIVSLITIIGPSTLAYTLGLSKYRYRHYGVFDIHFLASIIIGELFFLIISSGIIGWQFMFYNFICNVIFSVSFYFYGVYRGKKKMKKVSII